MFFSSSFISFSGNIFNFTVLWRHLLHWASVAVVILAAPHLLVLSFPTCVCVCVVCARACALQEMDERNFHWPRHCFITIVCAHILFIHTHMAQGTTLSLQETNRVLNQKQITLHPYTCHSQAGTHTHGHTNVEMGLHTLSCSGRMDT